MLIKSKSYGATAQLFVAKVKITAVCKPVSNRV